MNLFKTSRPFADIFYMGKEMGSFFIFQIDLYNKKEDVMKKEKRERKEVCPRCGKEKVTKGGGAWGNELKKVCPTKNCKPTRSIGN